MQGQQSMAQFRARIKELTLQKSAARGRLISQKELAEGSGVPITTLSRWSNNDFDRMDADTVAKLTRYFECKLSDLIELVD